MIVLYSTGCPKCNVLKLKLNTAKIEYTECKDELVMIDLGISSVPVLSVDGVLYTFEQAVKWVLAAGGRR